MTIITISHQVGSSVERAGPMDVRPVKIGSGTWLGSSATVLPGVTIGEGVVVTAGSVVNSDIPDNSLYGGVPTPELREVPV